MFFVLSGKEEIVPELGKIVCVHLALIEVKHVIESELDVAFFLESHKPVRGVVDDFVSVLFKSI